MEVLAYEEGARLYQMALDALDLQRDPNDERARMRRCSSRSATPRSRAARPTPAADRCGRRRRPGQGPGPWRPGRPRRPSPSAAPGPLPGVVDQEQVSLLEDALELLG